MVTGIITTDREGRIQDVPVPETWEGMFGLQPGSISPEKNIKDFLFKTERFKEARVQNWFEKGLESLASLERKCLLIDKDDDAVVEVQYLPGREQFCYILNPSENAYIKAAEYARHLMVNPIVTAGGLLEQILKLLDYPEPWRHLKEIKLKAWTASQEIKLLERLIHDITIIQKLESGKFEIFPEKDLKLKENVIDPIHDAFVESYGKRKIGVKYKDVLKNEVMLTADRIGLRFIANAFFSIPVINSKVNDFTGFYVSYGHEFRNKNGRNMHTIIYWTQWPPHARTDSQDIEKILELSEYTTSKDLVTGEGIPQIGLKYSRDIARKHGGDIEIEHKPFEKEGPAMEFRLYIPADLQVKR